jgi:hypothetical protein
MDVGQKVRVCRIRDRVPNEVAAKLGQVGTVKEFKMTDGSGIGAKVVFADNSGTWFFDDELEVVQ